MSVSEKVPERGEAEKKYFWNVGAMYENWGAWDLAFESLSPRTGGREKWALLSERPVDSDGPEEWKELLDCLTKTDRELSFLYTYAHLRHDEDVREERAKQAYMNATALLHSFRERVSWIDPALLRLSSERLTLLLQADCLADYRVFLGKIVRLKPHTGDASEERLIAFAEKALDVSQTVFGSLTNADLKFPPCRDEKGNLKELTLGTYQTFLKSYDRTLRKEAFTKLHGVFGSYENTLCDLIHGSVREHIFLKKARRYSSCLEAALYPNQIPVAVYTSLIQTVGKRLDSLHRYVKLRKKILGYDTLRVYDLSVPLVPGMDLSFSYDEAVEAICRSAAPLGTPYQTALRQGLQPGEWVDLYENVGKRSGAYSSGCYGSPPYILMNWKGTFRDVMTLAHEAGHSMHSLLTDKHQKYQDRHYPIFLAETASCFHEELLFRHFLERGESREKKAYLISQKIDDLRNTLFRQALFAEFELAIHEKGEREEPLTPSLLKELYLSLTKKYFGEAMDLDPEVGFEWSRIPHFYYNFYVYQYATGISAAHFLANKVVSGEEGAREKYIGFLSSGASLDPLATLKAAGVDMTDPRPVDAVIDSFEGLTGELASLIG